MFLPFPQYSLKMCNKTYQTSNNMKYFLFIQPYVKPLKGFFFFACHLRNWVTNAKIKVWENVSLQQPTAQIQLHTHDFIFQVCNSGQPQNNRKLYFFPQALSLDFMERFHFLRLTSSLKQVLVSSLICWCCLAKFVPVAFD